MGAPATVGPQDVILFDGVCNFCSASVRFIIKRDPYGRFKFASLQSATAMRLLTDHAVSSSDLSTIILIHNGRVFQQSDAVLEIVRRLRPLWPVLYFFKIVPRFIRNAVYAAIAKRRYKLFGRKEACMIPTDDIKARFL